MGWRLSGETRTLLWEMLQLEAVLRERYFWFWYWLSAFLAEARTFYSYLLTGYM